MRSHTPRSADSLARARPLTLGGLALAVLFTMVALGCVPTGDRPELTDERIDDVAPHAAGPPCPQPDEPFERFGSAVVRVVRPDGPVERCVLVADTFELRARGLMEVDDLAGYDGMIFAYPDDAFDGFWMANTRIPLTIAFVDATGGVITVLDMEPCPESIDCPTYEPGSPFRWALEVPQGSLGGFGLGPGASFDPLTLPGGLE